MAAQPTPSTPDLHVPEHPVRIVTASALFDGHDASINIMRRIMQTQGAEVIHLGHNRCVQEVVDAAIEEDVQGVAVSSYQGGHVEYFEYLVQLLRGERRRAHPVVGGGGGVIVPEEIERLRAVRRHDLQPRGRPAARARRHDQPVVADLRLRPVGAERRPSVEAVLAGERAAVARAITGAPGRATSTTRRCAAIREAAADAACPVLGITGTGGSGKSSLTDELIRRLRVDQQDKLRVAVLADRPDPPPRRRCPARRPHPDELARRRPGLLPLASPRAAARRCPTHLDDVLTIAAGRRLRPRHRRDARHRPGRRRRSSTSPTSPSTS